MVNTGLAQFADSTSGLSALGLNGGAFIVQLLTFVVVFLILRQFAFKPIVKVLDQRRALIDSGITLGEQMQAEKAKLQAEIAKQLQTARQSADAIVSNAHTDARRVIEEAEGAARLRTEAMERSARQQIQLASARERAQLEREVVGLVADVSSVVIGDKLTTASDTRLVERALRERKAA